MWVTLVLAGLAAPACHKSDHDTRLTPAVCQATPDRCRTDSLFEMLGMLGEYLGRHGMLDRPQPGLVEGFYPGEQALAKTFEKLVKAYRKETGLAFDHRFEVEQSGAVRLTSPELADLVNSLYVSQNGFSTLDTKLLAGASREQRLRYLEGAYRRFGDGKQNLIRMANGRAKVVAIAQVLKDLGCTDVVTHEHDGFPMSFEVTFTPTKALFERLGIEPGHRGTDRDKSP